MKEFSELVFESLPPEILLYILKFVPLTDLLQCCCLVSKYFLLLTEESSIWKSLCETRWKTQFEHAYENQKYPFTISQVEQQPNFQWKQYFIQKYLIEKGTEFSWDKSVSFGGDTFSARYQHTAHVHNKKITVIGGQISNQSRFNDIFEIDTESFYIRKIVPNDMEKLQTHLDVAASLGGRVQPVPVIAKHASVRVNDVIYIYGGFDGISQAFAMQAYTPDTQTFMRIEADNVPNGNTNHSMCVYRMPSSNKEDDMEVDTTRIYMYGGLHSDSGELRYSDKFFFFDLATRKWYPIKANGQLPEERCGHRIDALGNKLYLFGGGAGKNWQYCYNDMCVYDVNYNMWCRPKCTYTDCPVVDVSSYPANFTLGPFLFYFGGGKWKLDFVSNDIFVFDTVTHNWMKLKTVGTPASSRDECVACVVDNMVFMIHGYSGGPYDDISILKMSKPLSAAFGLQYREEKSKPEEQDKYPEGNA